MDKLISEIIDKFNGPYEDENLAVIEVNGKDNKKFLQGQLTNDIIGLDSEKYSLSSYCTHQGKVIANVQVLLDDNKVLLLLPKSIISVFIDDSFVHKQIGQKKFSSVLKSTLMGIPLPLCSCGVIPVAATLKDYGASKGATISFVVSTPQTGLDSIFLTYGMLGPVFAIFRPIAAFISGLFCGLIVNSFDEEEHIHQSAENQFKRHNAPLIQRFKIGLEYGFLTLPKDIVVPLFQGLLIAASIGFFVPPDFIIASTVL